MKNLFLLALTLLATWVNGQTINGTISEENGQPIENAQIFLKNSDYHAHSDANGFFTFPAGSLGDTLLITHLLYEQVAYPLTEEGEVNIQMQAISFKMQEVKISRSLKAINTISRIDLATAPVQSSQEILRKVPGLFIGQHAGGGKAEQIFLRGFDIDHGTDIALTVDGMPVNMVSHAHGQGYADLHFLIPETVEKIDFGKGPYYADKGNFATAGYVDFKTKKNLGGNLLKLEYGQFNRLRTLGMFELANKNGHNGYVAAEYLSTDGFFEASQNFHRLNLFGKYSAPVNENGALTLTLSHFNSKWDASGQIPQRAIDQGLITRFGAIDNTEGGQTGRSNAKLDYTQSLGNDSYLKSSVFYSAYDFELYSNFTFFLNDSLNGDQIRQREKRQLFGMNSEWGKQFGVQKHQIQAGAGLRNDRSRDNELSRTLNRTTTLSPIQMGDVNETNLFAYGNLELNFGKWMINPGLRIDHFTFRYQNQITPAYDPESASEPVVSPKLNILFQANDRLQLYVKTGMGFHSNDTRVVLAGQKQFLPQATGAEIGTLFKPNSRLFLNAAIWALQSQQEFVYVGDEGIVEAGGRSARTGVELSFRSQITKWLFGNLNLDYTHARSMDAAEGEAFIPLAPSFTATVGLSVKNLSGFSGGISARYLADRAANEDYSLTAQGYLVCDANASYQWKMLEFGVSIENLFNTQWKETQFATESRLQNEPQAVEEIHFTPGTPFSLRSYLAVRF